MNDYNQRGSGEEVRSIGEDVGKFGPLHIASGNVKWFIHHGKEFGIFSKS